MGVISRDVVLVEPNAVPEEPDRTKCDQFEGKFTNFLSSAIKLFAIKNCNIFIEIQITELKQSLNVNMFVFTRIFLSSR